MHEGMQNSMHEGCTAMRVHLRSAMPVQCVYQHVCKCAHLRQCTVVAARRVCVSAALQCSTLRGHLQVAPALGHLVVGDHEAVEGQGAGQHVVHQHAGGPDVDLVGTHAQGRA